MVAVEQGKGGRQAVGRSMVVVVVDRSRDSSLGMEGRG